jgi:hypothetical protein
MAHLIFFEPRPIQRLGLIDRFSHRLAPKETGDHSHNGTVVRLEQSRAHQPQAPTKGPSVDPAVFLFGVASSSDQGLVMCLSQSKEGWDYAHSIVPGGFDVTS